MAPLAGKPPFATDEPDSFYESPPITQQRRPRQPAPVDPNQRTSAYNSYDEYLGDDKNKNQLQPPADNSNRNSGVGALGMGLLNMDGMDSDDDDDDPKPTKPLAITTTPLPPPSKHAALAAATSPTRPNFPPVQQRQPQLQMPSPTHQMPSPTHQMPSPTHQMPSPTHQPQAAFLVMPQGPQPHRPPPAGPHHVPQPIAAPRPGYAAPISALNLARPELAAAPAGRMPPPKFPQPQVHNPFEPPSYPQPRPPHSMPASPAPSAPHPLHPSVTPITPAFIRPSKSPAPPGKNAVGVKFSEGEAIPRKPIMRGNSEETLLPGRGEKGDDFWRRFSMVAKEGNGRSPKESSWLHQMRNGSNRYSRWVWMTAILLLVLIAGGIVLGLFLRRNAPAHQQPKTLGGSADSLATPTTSVATATTAPHSSSSLHVSPTLTLKNRDEPTPSAVRVHGHRRSTIKRRL